MIGVGMLLGPEKSHVVSFIVEMAAVPTTWHLQFKSFGAAASTFKQI